MLSKYTTPKLFVQPKTDLQGVGRELGTGVYQQKKDWPLVLRLGFPLEMI